MKQWNISVVSLLQQDNFVIQKGITHSVLFVLWLYPNTKDTKENNILGAYFWKCYNVSPFEHSLSRFKKRKMKIMTYRKKQIVKNNNAAPRCSLYRLRSVQHYRISKGLVALFLEHRSCQYTWWPKKPQNYTTKVANLEKQI